jgi:N-hydroxyarylamine O-acetyltransferase
MDVSRYLERIKFKGRASPDIGTLEAIHRHHVLHVPFENLDIYNKKEIILEIAHLYNKIVENNRGGFCYELNGLFYWMLCELGFVCKMVSARVYNDEGMPGPEFDHMGIIVRLDSQQWLADVGFGDSFIKPLKMELNADQKQYGKTYRIVDAGDGGMELLRSTDSTLPHAYEKQYLFTLTKRKLSDYNAMCRYHQSSPDSHFTKKRMCTIAREDGRITLSGLKLIENTDKVKREIELKNEKEFEEKLKEYFGIEV